MIVNTVVYYVLLASAFLIYGIGTENLISSHNDYGSLLLTYVKSLITSTATVSVSYLIANALLAPAHLSELYPLVTIFVFVIFSAVIEVFIGIGLQNSITEFGVPFLCVLLAMNEATSIGYAIVIVAATETAYYVLIGIVDALRNWFDIFAPVIGLRVFSLLLISLSIIVLALSAFNVSWLSLLEVAQ
ncbi:MAG: hypothetical protein IJS09_07795 [Treponema sp.]|nr:hypothetical protein [Treponema sp.]